MVESYERRTTLIGAFSDATLRDGAIFQPGGVVSRLCSAATVVIRKYAFCLAV